MTRLNFTFQEASPLIKYSGSWVEGSSANDTLSASYNGSFRVTFTDGAAASLRFFGSAVSLFGATRGNHGNYSVQLDDRPLFQGVGFTQANFFNKSLWNADNLGNTEHTVVLKNIVAPSGPFLDLDYVSIERQIGLDGDEIFQTAFDDDSPAVQYVGDWEKTTGRSTAYQGTLHTTNAANALAVIQFHGCCVELYGQYANAPYSVTLDRQPPVNMTGLDVDLTPDFQHPQTLLYLVDGLSEANHTVTLTNINSNVNRPFIFDYAIVRSTQNITSNGSAPPNQPSSGPAGSHGDDSTHTSTPLGAIVGGAVGGVVALLALLILGFLFMRRRRRQRQSERSFPLDLIEESELEPKPYILPNHPQSQSTTGGAQPPHAGAGGPIPPSKRHQIANYYPQIPSTSEEGLLSPEEQSAAGRSGSYGVATSSGTGAAQSAASGPSSETSATMSSRGTSHSSSTPRRSAKSRTSLSRHTTEETAEHQTVQEEDAGAILSPEDVPVARSLPPAYNPEWHRQADS